MPPFPYAAHDSAHALASLDLSEVISSGDLLTLVAALITLFLLGELTRAIMRLARLVVFLALACAGLLAVVLAFVSNI
jgi:hypothetical protein